MHLSAIIASRRSPEKNWLSCFPLFGKEIEGSMTKRHMSILRNWLTLGTPDALWDTWGTPSKGKKVRKIFKKVSGDERNIIPKKSG